VGKYGRARQATHDNIIRRMRIACWITKATDTHSEYVIFIALPRQKKWHLSVNEAGNHCTFLLAIATKLCVTRGGFQGCLHVCGLSGAVCCNLFKHKTLMSVLSPWRGSVRLLQIISANGQSSAVP
jgi:hypothetical protein